MATPEEQLKDYILQGLVNDIFVADEARFVATAIGNQAEFLNGAGFGLLFGSLQVAYSDRQTLFVSRLFDRPSRKYLTRSIPAVLDLIEAHASQWALPERSALEEVLISAGGSPSEVSSQSDEDLCRVLAAHYRANGPHSKGLDSLSQSLARLQQSRNKAIAHNECPAGAARTLPTWGDARSVVDYAKDFARTVAWGFLGLNLGDGSHYDLTDDAAHVSIELEQLIKRAFKSNAESTV